MSKKKYTNPNGRPCAKCKIFKSWSEFGKNQSQRSGYDSYCKSCNRVLEARQWKKWFQALSPLDKFKFHLQNKYRNEFTFDDYQLMFAAQAGKCKLYKLCNFQGLPLLDLNGNWANVPRSKRLVIDHRKGTKRVRGLLCRDCNVTLGFIETINDFSIIWGYLNE